MDWKSKRMPDVPPPPQDDEADIDNHARLTIGNCGGEQMIGLHIYVYHAGLREEVKAQAAKIMLARIDEVRAKLAEEAGQCPTS